MRGLAVFLLTYALFLTVNSFFLSPCIDSYYYWSWGQHLAFGYLDGPPLIAYWMRFAAFLFGNTFFAINFSAVILVLCTTYVVFKIARLLLNSDYVAMVAAVLWFVSDSTMLGLIFKVTYDNLEQLFWLLSVYFILEYISKKLNRYLYYAAIALGFLLLSKYSGFILILACLLFFMSAPSERAIFKNKNFYYAMVLAVLIFMPNLSWNIQHHWLTFDFQLHRHPLRHITPVMSMLHFVYRFLKDYGLCVAAIIILMVKHERLRGHDIRWTFFYYVSLLPLVFWFAASFFAYVNETYLLFFNSFVFILLAHYLVSYQHKKIIWPLLIIYFAYSVMFLIRSDVHVPRGHVPNLIAQALKLYAPNQAEPIITESDDIFLAEVLFQSPKRTVSYVQTGIFYPGQFSYWDVDFQNKIRAKQVPAAIYMSSSDNAYYVKPYFKSCVPFPVLKHNDVKRGVTDQFFVYHCQN